MLPLGNRLRGQHFYGRQRTKIAAFTLRTFVVGALGRCYVHENISSPRQFLRYPEESVDRCPRVHRCIRNGSYRRAVQRCQRAIGTPFSEWHLEGEMIVGKSSLRARAIEAVPVRSGRSGSAVLRALVSVPPPPDDDDSRSLARAQVQNALI